MYQSPIEIMMGDIQSKIIEHQEKMTMNMVRDIGINVDKDELVKALQYDRQQYSKGYSDAIKETRPRWIPVSERLPQESLNSIIGWDDYRKRCVLVQYIDGHFQITGKAESFDIKAWMPLPQPYGEVEE